jgi:hypothetical protein
MGGSCAHSPVIFDHHKTPPWAERLLNPINERGLIPPPVEDANAVDEDAHAVRRDRGEDIGALIEGEIALPARREALGDTECPGEPCQSKLIWLSVLTRAGLPVSVVLL